jgi:NADH dehydrogenase
VIIEASAELGVEWLVNAEVRVDASGVTLKDGQVIASRRLSGPLAFRLTA